MADEFLVYPFDSVGCDESTTKIARELMITELAAVPGAKVTSATGTCFEEACAQEALKGGKADAIIVGRLFTLGDTTSLKMIVVWKKDTIHYKANMTNVGELDRVAPRLAQAITKKAPYDQSATVETVTKKEQETYRRVEGDFTWGPGLGVLVPANHSYGGASALYMLTLLFRYETAKLGFEFETGVYFNDDDDVGAGEFPLDFSMLYFFSKSNTSMFVGGTAGLHYIGVNIKDEDGQNENEFGKWTPSVAGFVGVEMLRTQTFHFLARAGYRTAFVAFDGPGAHGPYAAIGFVF